MVNPYAVEVDSSSSSSESSGDEFSDDDENDLDRRVRAHARRRREQQAAAQRRREREQREQEEEDELPRPRVLQGNAAAANVVNRSNQDPAPPAAAAAAAAPPAAPPAAAPARRARGPLRSFLHEGDIRSPGHAAALTGILQLMAAHQEGIGGAMGRGRFQKWVEDNIDVLSRDDGPLGNFDRMRPKTLQSHLSKIIAHAKAVRENDHSAEGGERGEDVPRWMELLWSGLDAMTNQDRDNNRVIQSRQQQQQIVRGAIGGSAPLGAEPRNANEPGHALRDERSSNVGGREMRVQSVGNVGVERVHDNMQLIDPSSNQQSRRQQPQPREQQQQQPRGLGHGQQQRRGGDGQQQQQQQQRQGGGGRRGRNSTTRRNVHLGSFEANNNDPSARFHHITTGYQSLNRLTDTIASAIGRPMGQQHRNIEELSAAYAQVLQQQQQHPGVPIFQIALGGIESELRAAVAAGPPLPQAPPVHQAPPVEGGGGGGDDNDENEDDENDM